MMLIWVGGCFLDKNESNGLLNAFAVELWCKELLTSGLMELQGGEGQYPQILADQSSYLNRGADYAHHILAPSPLRIFLRPWVMFIWQTA